MESLTEKELWSMDLGITHLSNGCYIKGLFDYRVLDGVCVAESKNIEQRMMD